MGPCTRGLNIRQTIFWFFMARFLLVSNGGETDISCLKSFKDSIEDPFSYLDSSWNFTNNIEEGFICKFTGVECWHAMENKVMSIQLSNFGLTGEFPPGISNCTSLTALNLSSNNLFGPIPLDISKLIPYVTSLDLSSNNLSGEIPPDITNISYLNELRLDRNQLTGQIPPAIALLRRLKIFSFANNRLSGPVPKFDGDRVFFTAESYANNSGLCGPPLADCNGDNDHRSKKSDNDQDSFIIGFVVGWPVAAVSVFAVTWFYIPSTWAEKVMKRRNKKNGKERRGKEQSKRNIGGKNGEN